MLLLQIELQFNLLAVSTSQQCEYFRFFFLYCCQNNNVEIHRNCATKIVCRKCGIEVVQTDVNHISLIITKILDLKLSEIE